MKSSFKFFPVFQFGQKLPPPQEGREMARIYISVFTSVGIYKNEKKADTAPRSTCFLTFQNIFKAEHDAAMLQIQNYIGISHRIL